MSRSIAQSLLWQSKVKSTGPQKMFKEKALGSSLKFWGLHFRNLACLRYHSLLWIPVQILNMLLCKDKGTHFFYHILNFSVLHLTLVPFKTSLNALSLYPCSVCIAFKCRGLATLFFCMWNGKMKYDSRVGELIQLCKKTKVRRHYFPWLVWS